MHIWSLAEVHECALASVSSYKTWGLDCPCHAKLGPEPFQTKFAVLSSGVDGHQIVTYELYTVIY